MVKLRLLMVAAMTGLTVTALHAQLKNYATLSVTRGSSARDGAVSECYQAAEAQLRSHGLTVTSQQAQPNAPQLAIVLDLVDVPVAWYETPVYVATASVFMPSTLGHRVSTSPKLAVGSLRTKLSNLCAQLADAVSMDSNPWP